MRQGSAEVAELQSAKRVPGQLPTSILPVPQVERKRAGLCADGTVFDSKGVQMGWLDGLSARVLLAAFWWWHCGSGLMEVSTAFNHLMVQAIWREVGQAEKEPRHKGRRIKRMGSLNANSFAAGAIQSFIRLPFSFCFCCCLQ